MGPKACAVARGPALDLERGVECSKVDGATEVVVCEVCQREKLQRKQSCPVKFDDAKST